MPRVLIVEDDALIALSMEDQLVDAGFEVVSVGSLVEGEQALESQRFDAAILDFKVGRESSLPISAWLTREGIPYLLCTGSTLEEVQETYGEGVVVVTKPFLGDLVAAVEAMTRDH